MFVEYVVTCNQELAKGYSYLFEKGGTAYCRRTELSQLFAYFIEATTDNNF